MIDLIKYYCIECGKELEVYEFDKCIFCKEKDKVLKESSEDNATNTWGSENWLMILVRIMGIVVFIYNLIFVVADFILIGAEGESQISTLDKIMILMTMFIAIVVTFR